MPAMPTLLIDMPSGVAGDMLLAALIACGADRARIEADLLALGCGPIRLRVEAVMAGPLSALRLDVDAEQEPRWIQAPAIAGIRPVEAPPEHQHRPYARIRDLIAAAALPERVAARAQRCFRLLAEAEGAVHGVPADDVEFHEVGAIDAIADVVGCCLALEQLGIDRVIAGPIVPGHGTVRCAHGRMPVPVPAVARMLQATGAPTRLLGQDTGELTTPTGCALVCGLADAFVGSGSGAEGRVTASGTGAGHKEIPGLVNAVRCLVVDEARTVAGTVQIDATIDDMSGEDLAIALARLLELGALDAWTAPLTMKKGRPGHLLSVLCSAADRRRLGEAVLTHTTSIGLRWHAVERMVLPREAGEAVLEGQRIRTKTVVLPDGSRRTKPEADDVVAAAMALGLPVAEVRRRLASAPA